MERDLCGLSITNIGDSVHTKRTFVLCTYVTNLIIVNIMKFFPLTNFLIAVNAY
jgi:hypothetical protein